GPNRKRTVQTESMNRREAAEESAAYRTALDEGAGRNASGSVRGAASAASDESHCIGQGTGLMEQMIERGNLNAAWKQVRRNKGAAGVDGLDFERTATLIRKERDKIKALLLAGRYRPEPVRRVEIPKASGGTRRLGVPTILDRFLQQAALQVLGPLFEPHFSEHSYGFRPGRSAHQAVLAAREYQRAAQRWVVDIDLASFFDEVNHDLLVARVRRSGEGRADASTHPGVPAQRRDGGWGESAQRERHAARRAIVAVALQHPAGRPRQGTGEARASVLSLRGRLQYLRRQSTQRRAGARIADPVPRG